MGSIFGFIHDHWVRFLISLLIGIATSLIYLFVNGVWNLAFYYSNAFFIGGFALLSISILSILNIFGAFDIFAFYPTRKKKSDGEKETLYDFSERKREERGRFKLVFVPYLSFAVIFLVAAVILYFNI